MKNKARSNLRLVRPDVTTPDTKTASARNRLPVATLFPLLGWMAFLALFTPARVLDFDVGIRAQISRSLWSQGSVWVDKGSAVDDGLLWMTENKGTSFYGMGQSLVLIPFDMAGAALEFLSDDRKTQAALAAIPIALAYVPLIGGIWFWMLGQWLQSWAIPATDAKKACLAFFLATPALYYCTQSAQEEALVASLGLTALWFAKKAADSQLKDSRALFFCGLLAGFTLLVRLNSLFFFIPVLGLLWDSYQEGRNSFKRALPNLRFLVAGGLIPIAFHCAFAYLRFGSIAALGYDEARQQAMGVFWTSFQPDIALGFLFGMGKGIFILAPALLLAFIGARTAYKYNPGFGISTAVAILASCIFHGHIANNPDGSECWSVRYLMHLTSLLVLPAWFGFTVLRESEIGKAATYIAVAVGGFFAVLSLMAPNSLEYSQAHAEAKLQKTLMLSWTDGQLARRATNVSLRFSGEPLDESRYASTVSEREREQITTLSKEYLPNIWPWVLSRKFPQYALWFWIAWIGLAAGAWQLFSTKPSPTKPSRELTLL
jgi:hypothetical protein